jgi:hypothetical protein
LSTVKVAARKKVLPRPPPDVRVWPYKATDPAAPQWPEDNYEIAKSDVFHVRTRATALVLHENEVADPCDGQQKGNSYYDIELHVAEPPRKRRMYRIFTHAGSVSDLDTNAEAGTKEVRYLDNLQDAESTYSQLYIMMSSHLGYKRVNLLASSRIGSDKVHNAATSGPAQVDN